jgi:hypothetical protein
MRKLFAIMIICFSFVLIKNEKASSKGSCKLSCNTLLKETSLPAAADDAPADEPKEYDGFFFKI